MNNIISALKDWRVIVILVAMFSGFAVAYYGMNETAAKTMNHNNALAKSVVEKLEVIRHDTVTVTKEITVTDTIREYIKSVSYSSIIPSKIDTFETYKGGKIDLSMEWNGGIFEIEANEIKLLCNGRLFKKFDEDGDDITDCAGEWILAFKGER